MRASWGLSIALLCTLQMSASHVADAATCTCKNPGKTRVVTPKRVRSGLKGADDPAFGTYFDSVPSDEKRSMYVSDISPSGTVENIVATFGGQQGIDLVPGAAASAATGQVASYKPKLGNPKPTPLSACAFFARLMHEGKRFLPAKSTHATFVFDAAFYYADSKETRTSIVKAFTDYVLSKGSPKAVRNIVLAGGSRGAALAYLIAKEIRDRREWDHVNVFASLFEGVLNEEAGEGGSSKIEIDNPLVADDSVTKLHGRYYAWKTDVNAFFPNKARLNVFQIVAGQPVGFIPGAGLTSLVPGAGIPHGFAYNDKKIDGLNGFYWQHWIVASHLEICRSCEEPPTVDLQLEWVLKRLAATNASTADASEKR